MGRRPRWGPRHRRHVLSSSYHIIPSSDHNSMIIRVSDSHHIILTACYHNTIPTTHHCSIYSQQHIRNASRHILAKSANPQNKNDIITTAYHHITLASSYQWTISSSSQHLITSSDHHMIMRAPSYHQTIMSSLDHNII